MVGVRTAARVRRLVLRAGMLAWAGCGSEAPPPPVERTEPSPQPEVQLRVLYAGCREVRAGPVCAIDPGAELRLWVALDSELPAALWVDGARVEATRELVDEGVRWTVVPPPQAQRLEIRADLDGATGRFGLALDPRPRPSFAALERIEGMADPKKARAELRALLPTLEGSPRARALEHAAVLAAINGDHGAMLDAHERAYEAAREQGWLRDASLMAQPIAFDCIALRYDESCAKRWLQRDAEVVVLDPEQQMNHAYFEGLFAERSGDLRAALEIYRAQERDAHRLGSMIGLEVGALTQQMLLVGRLGAHEHAQRLRMRAEQLEPRADGFVLRGQLLDAIGWMLLEARGRGRDVDDPVPLFERALAVLDQNPNDDTLSAPTRQAILLNLAYAAVLDGGWAEALHWIDEIDANALEHENQQWLRLLRARVAGSRGEPTEALKNLEALLDAADRLYQPELRWQALVSRGEVLEALGRPEPALHSYFDAEQLLEASLSGIALGDGRERFAAERSRSTRRLVDLLLRMDRPERALCAARLARTRPLRALARQLRGAARASAEQREALQRYREARIRLEAAYDASWELPAAAARQQQRALEQQRRDNQRDLDALLAQLDPGPPADPSCDELTRPVQEGQLDLHYLRLDDGWVGFAVDVDGVVARRLGTVSPGEVADRDRWAQWGRELLDPFAEPLGRTRAIRVMPSGPLTRVPFHALPVPGQPARMLLDLAPVEYGLDLPLQERRAATEHRALVVAPPSNLAHALDEAHAAERALMGIHGPVQLLEGDAATGQAVRAALPAVDWLHYVGHARSDGLSGWDSTLSLARGGVVGVGDVLALPRAPRTVVLDGCETGLTDPEALAGGMSLAHAFVLAGSEWVLASARKLDDEAAAGLMRAFFEAMASGEGMLATIALQRAQQQRRPYDDGWLHVRAWVP